MRKNKDLFIGIDLGSSFIKISIVDQAQYCLCTIRVPDKQMSIDSAKQGYAQQNPQLWWLYIKQGLQTILKDSRVDKKCIKGIGISYQMHGLVVINQKKEAIISANIWCDSRATLIGQQLYDKIKTTEVIKKVLNHPSNFTLSKLLWIKQNNIQLYKQIFKIMLPGDFIAMKLTNKVQTSKLGLSEGIFWDYETDLPCYQILQISQISKQLLPEIAENFSFQSQTTEQINKHFNFIDPIPVFYRSGDQPNNAFSLDVLKPGQVAVAGGTSGVIFAVTQSKKCQQILKFNTFLHVNHTTIQPRIGKLLCINGCGIAYSWVRKNMFEHLNYNRMNQVALNNNSEGIIFLPFGNGVERMFRNKDIKCHFKNINFTKHNSNNIIRAVIQGLAFSFIFGADIMKDNQIKIEKLKAGKNDLFQCQIFCEIISTVLGVNIQIYDTSGSQGAAKGALLGFLKVNQLIQLSQFKINPKLVKCYVPNNNKQQQYLNLYNKWRQELCEAIDKKQCK